MKKAVLTLLVTLFLTGMTTHANYQCVDAQGKIAMGVVEKHTTHLGNASVTLASGTQKKYFYGNLQSDNGTLFKKKVIELYPYRGDSLTIIHKPTSCGRGLCDAGTGAAITAHLKIGPNQNYFSCSETKL